MVGWGVLGRVEGGGSLLRVGCAGMSKWCACNEFGVGMEIGREYAIIDWCGVERRTLEVVWDAMTAPLNGPFQGYILLYV